MVQFGMDCTYIDFSSRLRGVLLCRFSVITIKQMRPIVAHLVLPSFVSPPQQHAVLIYCSVDFKDQEAGDFRKVSIAAS